MLRHFQAAPWATSLKVLSILSVIILGCVSYAAFRVVPTPSGFTHDFGTGVAFIPLLLLVGCVFFVVRGFTLDPTELVVTRLITSTRIPLEGLTHVWTDPNVLKGSIRVVGNGGLFSFTGWFYSRRLGRYRLFATDFRHAVVLKFRDRVVVITPASPEAFIHHLQMILPGVQVGAAE